MLRRFTFFPWLKAGLLTHSVSGAEPRRPSSSFSTANSSLAIPCHHRGGCPRGPIWRCGSRIMKMRRGPGVPTGLWLSLLVIPGLRCAPPWDIYLRSLRELGVGLDWGEWRTGPTHRDGTAM